MSTTPHNDLVKRVFLRPENAAAEFRAVLPPALLARIDLDRLAVAQGSFVDPDLTWRHTDLLYSVPIGDKQAFIYVLFEHQSKADRWMPLRMLRYQLRVWDKFIADHPRATELPPIVPLLLEHDDAGGHSVTAMHDLFADDLIADPHIAAGIPAFRFLVDDLSRVSDDALRARRMTAFARVALLALRDGRTDLLARSLAAFTDLLEELLAADQGPVDLGTILHYIFLVQGTITYRKVIDILPSLGTREAAVTIAEQLREEGLQKGLQQGLEKGRQEGRRALLRQQIVGKFGPLDAETARWLKEADGDTLDRLAVAVLSATTLDELRAA